MSTDKFIRIKNTYKILIIVDLGKCPTRGARLYNLHKRQELLFDDIEIIENITGRNGLNQNEPKPPHSTWREVTRTMTTKARPNRIKCSSKLIKQCKCCCMKKIKPTVCSCDIYEELKDALRFHKKYHKVWQHLANKNRKGEIIRRTQADNVPIAEIMESFWENPDQLLS